ncbi:unnamed protein product [Diabrotica balteata]|uniref:Uncharacterized protein n=1 Tax=Diabrotica balteata TaxID=107213 RepID=A0A9N9SV62_DIABA|nr:unnamed protein product [Diabrotica balteata]
MHGVLSKSANLINLIGTSKMSSLAFKTLAVSVPKEFVYHVKLNRPEKRNAFNHEMWLEIKDCFQKISDDENCRAVVLSGEGKLFTSGIDLTSFLQQGAEAGQHEDPTRKAKVLSKLIQLYQESMSSLELCKKPVLAAIHSACIGAGVDLITAADIRYCTKDAYFQVKEVEVGLAADVGSLQRLPKVIGSDSLTRELCYTSRKMHADEALTCGLVSKYFTLSNSEMKSNDGFYICNVQDAPDEVRFKEAPKSPVKKIPRYCRALRRIHFSDKILIIDNEKYFTLSNSEMKSNDGFYINNVQDAPDEVRFKEKVKFADKILVWCAISEAVVSQPFIGRVRGEALNADNYVDRYLTRLVQFLNTHHPNDEIIFWPDLASCYYARRTTDWLTAQNVNFVPKRNNPPNVPHARHIEEFWSVLSRMVYNSGWEAQNEDQLNRRILETIRKQTGKKFLNQLNLQSEDIVKAATAQLTKDPNVVFAKL